MLRLDLERYRGSRISWMVILLRQRFDVMMRCIICGTRAESFGGPTICSWCNIGDFGLARIQRQNSALRRLNNEVERFHDEVERLRVELSELKDGKNVAV